MSTILFKVLSRPNFHELSCWSICRFTRTEIQCFSSTNWQENDRRTLCSLVCNRSSEQYKFELVRRFPTQLDHIHRMLLSQCEKSVSLIQSKSCNVMKLNWMKCLAYWKLLARSDWARFAMDPPEPIQTIPFDHNQGSRASKHGGRNGEQIGKWCRR